MSCVIGLRKRVRVPRVLLSRLLCVAADAALGANEALAPGRGLDHSGLGEGWPPRCKTYGSRRSGLRTGSTPGRNHRRGREHADKGSGRNGPSKLCRSSVERRHVAGRGTVRPRSDGNRYRTVLHSSALVARKPLLRPANTRGLTPGTACIRYQSWPTDEKIALTKIQKAKEPPDRDPKCLATA